MFKIKIIITIFLLLIIFPKNIFAQTEIVNNKFGIHITSENDLEKAAELVNSNGGQWGYVTIVIREDERNHDRWQRVFDQMRRLKLIPIVRIATTINNSHWEKPRTEEVNNWSAFLNGLLWPVKERYVVLYNEPNHAKEWGGEIAPKEYANIVKLFKDSLLSHSEEFKILPAALDLAAPNSGSTMEASRFWEIAHEADNFIFTSFDVWNSHSYPNPGFSGSVTDTGKKSIQGYKWEIDFLENFGLDPEIDVFITETGWVNGSASDKYEYAFKNVWNDPQIKAITPFILNYSQEPFGDFSWLDAEGKPKEHFNTVKSMTKQKGTPEQHHEFELESNSIASSLVSNSKYQFFIKLKNTGQSIWSTRDGFSVQYKSTLNSEQILIGKIPTTEPGQTASIPINIETKLRGKHFISFQLDKNNNQIGDLVKTNFEIIAPPSLNIRVQGWFGEDDINNNFNLTLKDGEKTIMNIEQLLIVDGLASLPSVYNVIPGREYVLEIKKDYHQLKSNKFIMKDTENNFNFGRLLPIDFDNNGEINLQDVVVYVLDPITANYSLSPF